MSRTNKVIAQVELREGNTVEEIEQMLDTLTDMYKDKVKLYFSNTLSAFDTRNSHIKSHIDAVGKWWNATIILGGRYSKKFYWASTRFPDADQYKIDELINKYEPEVEL